jgi:hypothetical protein
MNSFVKNTDEYIKSVEEEMKGIISHNNKSKEDVEESVNSLPYRANWAAVGGYLHPQPGSSLVAPAGMAPLLRKALAIAGGFPNLITAPATVKEHSTAIKVEKYLDNQGGFW